MTTPKCFRCHPWTCCCEDPRIVGYENPAPPPAAPDGEVAMPDEVPSAGAFREAFKNATLPRGADYASWASGYCAGWTAAERAAAKGGA